MALPVLIKTWQHSVNQTLGPYANYTLQQQSILLALKNSLTGFGLAPWTVQGSSDGITAAHDAFDRWLVATDVNWTIDGDSGATRSWIVLQQTGVGTNLQMLFSCQSNGNTAIPSSLLIAISPSAGFTGGTTTDRPTAMDEHIVLLPSTSPTGFWGAPDTLVSADRFVLHVSAPTDGSFTGWHLWRDSRVMTYVAFGRLVETPMGAPIVFGGGSFPNTADGNDNNLKLSFEHWSTQARTNVFYNGILYPAAGYLSGESFNTSMVGEHIDVANEIDGTWHLAPVGVTSITPGIRGFLGRVPDFFWTSTGLSDGDTFPDDSSHQFAVFGDVVLPWNGFAPLVA